MWDKFWEEASRALGMIAGGLPWTLLGALGGVAMEAQAARIRGTRMGFWDFVIAYILAFTMGTLAWVFLGSLDISENVRASAAMCMCLLGREAGPMLKDAAAGALTHYMNKQR